MQEPFNALFTQGMITRDGAKMSKSKGNVISPTPYVERYGADTARCYILFIGPPDQDADWSDSGVEGVHRFLGRLWRLGAELAEQGEPAALDATANGAAGDDLELLRKAHWAIDKVTGDMSGRFAFNTAIAAVMELVNECYARARQAGEEIASLRDRDRRLADLPVRAAHRRRRLRAAHRARASGTSRGRRPTRRCWRATRSRSRCRSTASCATACRRPSSADGEQLESLARARPRVQAHIDGKDVVKVIVVPAKLVNFVVR